MASATLTNFTLSGLKVWHLTTACKIFLAKAMNQILPRLSMKSNLDINAISRDPEIIKNSQQDPLSCDFNTVRQGYEILKVLTEILEDVKKITLPILFTHGEKDRLSLAQGTEELFQNCASTDKDYHCFKAAYHELHNDLDKEAYFETLLDWLRQYTS